MAAPDNSSPLARMWNSRRYSNAALHAARRESFGKRFIAAADGIDMIHRRRRYRISANEQREAEAALDQILVASGRYINLSIIVGIAGFMLVSMVRTHIAAAVPVAHHNLVGNMIGAAPFVWALAIGIHQEVAIHRLFGRLAARATARAGAEPRMTEADLTIDSLPVGLLSVALLVAVIGALAWWLA